MYNSPCPCRWATVLQSSSPLEMFPTQCKAKDDVITTKLANRLNTGLQGKSIKLGKASSNEATQELYLFLLFLLQLLNNIAIFC